MTTDASHCAGTLDGDPESLAGELCTEPWDDDGADDDQDVGPADGDDDDQADAPDEDGGA